MADAIEGMDGRTCFVVVGDGVGGERVGYSDGRRIFIFDEGDEEVVWVRKDGGGADGWKTETVVHSDGERRRGWRKSSQTGR